MRQSAAQIISAVDVTTGPRCHAAPVGNLPAIYRPTPTPLPKTDEARMQAMAAALRAEMLDSVAAHALRLAGDAARILEVRPVIVASLAEGEAHGDIATRLHLSLRVVRDVALYTVTARPDAEPDPDTLAKLDVQPTRTIGRAHK